MLFLSEVAVLEDRVASSEDSGMTTVQAVTKESTDLNTPSPVRPVAQKMLSNYDDVLIAKETLNPQARATSLALSEACKFTMVKRRRKKARKKTGLENHLQQEKSVELTVF